MTPFETFTLLFQILLILFAYSFLLWKESHLFRFAQFTLAAVALANVATYTVLTIFSTGITPLMKGSYLYTIPIALGFLIYARLSNKYGWLSRWSMAILVGTGLGLAVRGMVESQIIDQMKANFLPLYGGAITPIDNIITILTTVFVMSYFFFTMKPKGSVGTVLNASGRIGRILMMIAFGSMFGNIVMTRMTWFSTRIGFIVDGIMTLLGLR